MEDWKAKQAARESIAAALRAANPHLIGCDKVDSLIAASKNIRTELKRAFPKTVFSVKTRRFSGGDAIDVRWTDGPTDDVVGAIVGRYSAGSFDGMDDSYTYSNTAWCRAFGDAKYVHTTRHNSENALESAARTAVATGRMEPGTAWAKWGDAGFELVHEIAQRRTWAVAKVIPADMEPEVEVAA